MKNPITVWRLLVWTYRNQMVQYEVDRHQDYLWGSEKRGRAFALTIFGNGSGRGCINEAGTTALPDAHLVHFWVMQQRKVAPLLIKTGAKGEPPDWDPPLPPPRIVPSRRSTGSIRMIYGVTRKGRKSHEQIGCWIEYEGISDEKAAEIRAEARATYTAWWEGLRLLSLQIHGLLDRWTITGLGAIREPWKNGY